MPAPTLPLDTTLLKPGLRLAVGLSGGADSVALLRALAERSRELGLVLHAAHLHHGLRGEEADGDLDFARALAAELGLPFHEARVDAGAAAKAANGETHRGGRAAAALPLVPATDGRRARWRRWPRRTPATTRRRRCWPSSCAAHGPRG